MNRITFEQFIKTYNFRYVCDKGKDYDNDTCIIRIYPPNEDYHTNEWFEFGIYDFTEKEVTWNMCKRIFTKEIINSYIYDIQFNPDYNNVVTIYLSNKKEMEF